MGEDAKGAVKKYYGKVLKSYTDFKTNACHEVDVPQVVKDVLQLCHEDVLSSRVVGHLKQGKTGCFAKTIFYFLPADSHNSYKVTIKGKSITITAVGYGDSIFQSNTRPFLVDTKVDRMAEEVTSFVKEYYGKVLKNSQDLKSNACVQKGDVPQEVKDALKLCHEGVLSRYYGCGLVFPSAVDGTTVLDFGSGAGRDCFILSKLVGQDGFVIGVDMTKEQVDVAKKHISFHMEKFGYSKPNVEFKLGYIENLKEAGIQDNSCDVIVSNCVINLTPDKPAVFKEAFRVLKEGGELYFSDMYSDQELSEEVKNNKELWVEGFGGSLYWKYFVDLSKEIGFSEPYLVTSREITSGNDQFEKILGDVKYVSATYRLFKTSKKPEEKCSGYSVKYKGTISSQPGKFTFDWKNTFDSNFKPVSSDIAMVLKNSRYARHFEFQELDQTSEKNGAPCTTTADSSDPFALISKNKDGPSGCKKQKCS